MWFTQFFIASLVAVASAKKKKPAPPAFTKTLVSKCMTASGPNFVPTVATSTKAVKLTTTITSTSTSTPVVEVTPEAVTKMTVECSTSTTTETASQETDTLLITTTFLETETAWESSTAYETEWSTITEITTTTPTVMPSAGFKPIWSEVSGKGKTPAKRDAALVPRAKKPVAEIKNGELVLPPQEYPSRVQCINVVYIVYYKVKVATASEASTITAITPTTTMTSTHVLVETSTELVEDATTTETISETSTMSVTSTHWETSTVTSSTTTTSLVPAATPYYAACGPENLLSSVSGAGISRIFGMSKQPLYTHTGVSSAYECCVLAIEGEYAGSAWYAGADGWCQLVGSLGACDATRESFQFGVKSALDPRGGFVVSNGNCGSGRMVGRY